MLHGSDILIDSTCLIDNGKAKVWLHLFAVYDLKQYVFSSSLLVKQYNRCVTIPYLRVILSRVFTGTGHGVTRASPSLRSLCMQLNYILLWKLMYKLPNPRDAPITYINSITCAHSILKLKYEIVCLQLVNSFFH